MSVSERQCGANSSLEVLSLPSQPHPFSHALRLSTTEDSTLDETVAFQRNSHCSRNPIYMVFLRNHVHPLYLYIVATVKTFKTLWKVLQKVAVRFETSRSHARRSSKGVSSARIRANQNTRIVIVIGCRFTTNDIARAGFCLVFDWPT